MQGEAGRASNEAALGVLPGPRLGDGPRWDLRRAVAGKERVAKEAVERQLQWLRERIKALKRDPMGLNPDDELYYDEDDYEEGELEVEEEDRLNLDAQVAREYIKQLEDELASLRAGPDARCIKMLDQALSGSEDADVQFVFQGRQCGVRGHRGMLCAGSKEFAGMFRSGMKEAKEGKIHVPPGVSLHGLRGLLEWLYLGRAGEECAKADGRELWVLGEMYEVAGMLEWLLEEGIDGSNVCAVYEFGLVPEGVDRKKLLARCLAIFGKGVRWPPGGAGLRGVGREAIKGLVLAHARQGGGKRIGWRHVRDSVHVLEEWVSVNGGLYGGGDVSRFREVMSELDLLGMPLKALREVLGGCEYANDMWAAGIVLNRETDLNANACEVEYEVTRQIDVGGNFKIMGRIAVDTSAARSRVAVIEPAIGNPQSRIAIINVDDGERVATIGPGELTENILKFASGVAFSGSGEMYVSDVQEHRIQVYDREGRYLRCFGRKGRSRGQFDHPHGMCFAADGNLVVADGENHRVQIFREDGSFVRMFGRRGTDFGEFLVPTDVCGGGDGSIAVLDKCNCRIQVFGGEGEFLWCFGEFGKGPGQFLEPNDVSAGPRGEIIISDFTRRDVQIFSRRGELLQIVGPDGDSKVSWNDQPWAAGTDAEGRLFVVDGEGSIVVLS